MADVIEINDIREVEAYRMAWNALLAETPEASFFATPEWLITYWKHFGADQQLRLLIVRSGGRPIGIVPLCIRTEKRSFGNVRVLGYPLDNWGARFGPIGLNQTAMLTIAMRHLASTPQDWDMIELGWTPHATSNRSRTLRSLNRAGLRAKATPNQQSALVVWEAGWEGYLASRTAKVRQDIRRNLRRLEEDSSLTFVRHRPEARSEGDGDPRWDLYEQCEAVAAKSWQADSPNGNTLSHAEYREFFRDAHEAAARRGMVEMNLLLQDGEPVAFNYNYRYQDRVFGLRTGYDRDCENRGVGKALTLKTLQASCLAGDALFELGVGAQEYKARIATGEETMYKITHLPLSGWKSQAVRLSHLLRRQTTEATGKEAVTLSSKSSQASSTKRASA